MQKVKHMLMFHLQTTVSTDRLNRSKRDRKPSWSEMMERCERKDMTARKREFEKRPQLPCSACPRSERLSTNTSLLPPRFWAKLLITSAINATLGCESRTSAATKHCQNCTERLSYELWQLSNIREETDTYSCKQFINKSWRSI